jgi:microcompartment protein CcmK/EutM
MFIGTVKGNIVSTINTPFYDGKRLMVVEKETGGYVIAIDSVDAGVGERVLVIDEGNSARQIVNDDKAPLRSIIVGIVDEVHNSH